MVLFWHWSCHLVGKQPFDHHLFHVCPVSVLSVQLTNSQLWYVPRFSFFFFFFFVISPSNRWTCCPFGSVGVFFPFKKMFFPPRCRWPLAQIESFGSLSFYIVRFWPYFAECPGNLRYVTIWNHRNKSEFNLIVTCNCFGQAAVDQFDFTSYIDETTEFKDGTNENLTIKCHKNAFLEYVV